MASHISELGFLNKYLDLNLSATCFDRQHVFGGYNFTFVWVCRERLQSLTQSSFMFYQRKHFPANGIKFPWGLSSEF